MSSMSEGEDALPPEGYVAAAVVLFLIGFFGISSNLIVIILFLREKQLWTPLNIILLNLVVSDFCVGLMGNPFPLISAIYHYWIFGTTWCQAYGFFMSLLGINAITTLTVLAFERYLMIARPFCAHRLTTRTGAFWLIGACWVHSLVVTVPPLVGWGEYVNESANISCSVNWERQDVNNTSYIVFLFVFGLFVPVIVITVSYVGIVRTMRRNIRGMRQVTRAERRVVYMVGLMIVAFLIAWTPYAVLSMLVAIWGRNDLVSPGLSVIPAIVAKSSICYNPIIYVALNTQFRPAWNRLLGRKNSDNGSMEAGNTNGSPTTYPSIMNADSSFLRRPPGGGAVFLHLKSGAALKTLSRKMKELSDRKFQRNPPSPPPAPLHITPLPLALACDNHNTFGSVGLELLGSEGRPARLVESGSWPKILVITNSFRAEEIAPDSAHKGPRDHLRRSQSLDETS
ncbi:parapinopsin [Bemisia tabaci]|uniref:parapinopsin n=1 Tax=Bemisia tabaci TaxID=7038 RepID=UPI003B2881AD